MPRFGLICLVCFSSLLHLQAQRYGGTNQDSSVIRNYFSFGGQVLSRGWSAGLQYERAGQTTRHVFLAYLSHFKENGEIRRESLFRAQEGTRFVMYKVNYLIPLHLGYGRSFTLIEKSKISRSRLGLSLTLGPTLGIVVPYQVYKFVPIQGNPNLGYREVATFYESLAFEDVIGEVGFISGTRNASYVMGMTGMVSVQLDFGEKEDFIRAAFLSFRGDFFPGKVEMIRQEARQSYLSGGVGFWLGNAW